MANQKPQTKPNNTTPEPILIQGSPIPYSSKSIIIFVLSIINLIIFPIIPGIIALTMVKNATQEITSSKGFLKGKELIKIGKIVAIVGLGIQTIGIIIGLIFMTIGIIIGAATLIAIA